MDPAQTAARLGALAARAYRHMAPWSEADFAEALTSPLSLLISQPGGFILMRVVADEAEILALATDPDRQRQGIARWLLAEAEAAAQARGAGTCFLEVAADNAPACALYASCGYAITGRRSGYYRRPGRAATDALLMAKALT